MKTNGLENRKTIEKTNATQSGFFEKNNNIDLQLVCKKKKEGESEKNQITKIKNNGLLLTFEK